MKKSLILIGTLVVLIIASAIFFIAKKKKNSGGSKSTEKSSAANLLGTSNLVNTAPQKKATVINSDKTNGIITGSTSISVSQIASAGSGPNDFLTVSSSIAPGTFKVGDKVKFTSDKISGTFPVIRVHDTSKKQSVYLRGNTPVTETMKVKGTIQKA